MHGRKNDLLYRGRERAKSSLPRIGAFHSTALASMTRLLVITFDTVQAAPFTCSNNLITPGTHYDWGAITCIGGRVEANQGLVVVLGLSSLAGAVGW